MGISYLAVRQARPSWFLCLGQARVLIQFFVILPLLVQASLLCSVKEITWIRKTQLLTWLWHLWNKP